MDKNELDMLREAVQGARSYVEIGTLWGGSLIAALQANPDMYGWAIDPMTGYYGGEDQDGNTPTLGAFLENLEDAGVRDRARLVVSKSYPFPLPDMRFDVGLVDGDHSEQAARQDWRSLSECCAAVLLHDIDDPAVRVVLDEVDLRIYTVKLIGRLALCRR